MGLRAVEARGPHRAGLVAPGDVDRQAAVTVDGERRLLPVHLGGEREGVAVHRAARERLGHHHVHRVAPGEVVHYAHLAPGAGADN